MIWIDVYPAGENLTHTTYTRPRAGHIWQPFTKLPRGRNRSATPGMMFWFSLGLFGLTIVLGYLILPPFWQPWSSGYSSSKCSLSYVDLLSPIYQHVVSTIWYLLNRAKMIRSLIDTDGTTTLEPRISTYHSLTLSSDDTPLSPSCLVQSQNKPTVPNHQPYHSSIQFFPQTTRGLKH
jgi:hypothetical protein